MERGMGDSNLRQLGLRPATKNTKPPSCVAVGPRVRLARLPMSRARFGLFEFDPASGVLTREGTPIRLQPQPARVLALLVEHAGELVTRDDLRAAVWGDATFVDFERGLNFCIAQVRGALGDSAESPRFVETIPRRGYRFIAPVSGQGFLPPKGGSHESGSDGILPLIGGSRGLIALACA